MKKLLSVLLALAMLVSVVSVSAFAEGETLSVVYNYTDATTGEATTLPVTEGVTAGGSFAIKFVAPNTSDKYFVGWYTDAEFTGEPVAAITVADGVNNLYARYKEYPTNANVNFLPIHSYDTHYPWAYFPALKTDGSLYAARARILTYSIGGVSINEDADGTYYQMNTNGPTAVFFADEDNMMYQLRPNANYTLTFQYKHNGAGDGTLSVSAALGKAKAAFGNISSLGDGAASWGDDRSAVLEFGGFTANNAAEWQTASITFSTSSLDFTNNYPLVGLRVGNAGWGDGEGLQFKNIVLEELVPEEFSVVYHYLDENGEETEKVITDGITLNQSYAIDWIANNTSDKYFTGWYASEACTGNPVASINLTIDGKNHIYGGYKEYKTTFSPTFNHGYDHYPDTIIPALVSGKYNPRTCIVNYSIGGIKTVEDAAGNYYSIDSNGSTMIFFPDENDYAYQAKPGAQYKITVTYKYASGNGFSLFGVVGMPRSAIQATPVGWGNGAAKYGDNRTPAAISDPKVEVVAEDAWKTATVIVDASAVDYSQNSAQIGLFLDEFTSGESLYFKNIVVEEYSDIVVPKVNVNLYANGQIVNTTEVDAGTKFNPSDFIPEAPEGKVFDGWYLDAEFTEAMPAEGVVVNEDTDLYAKFSEAITVKYYAGDKVVKSVIVEDGQSYTFENFMLDAADIPAGYYFTGWFSDEACTQPILTSNLTETVTISGSLARYAGLREYETSFSPTFIDATTHTPIQTWWNNIYYVYYPHTNGDNFLNAVYSCNYRLVNTLGDENQAIFNLASYNAFVLHDENLVAYQAKPGAAYTVSFKYKYTGATANSSVFVVSGLAKSFEVASANAGNQGYWWNANAQLTHKNATTTVASISAGDQATWQQFTGTLPALAAEDLASYYPLFAIKFGTNAGATLEVKDLVIEEILPEEFSVVYHYLNADGEETEKVITDGITLNQSYAIDWIANNTSDKYFVGWYASEACTGNPVASINLAIDGKNHIYGGYKEYKTTFSPTFNHGYDHYPHTVMPSLVNGVYNPRTNIVNYSIGGVKTVEDAAGNYYSVDSNGATMIFFPDENDYAYQAKPGAQYKITFTYKYGGSGAFNLYGVVGMPRSSITGVISWTGCASYGDNRTPAAISEDLITVNDSENWNTATLIVDASDVDYSQNSAQIGFFLDEFTSGESFYFKDVVVEEYAGNVGEYSEQLNGVVYDLGEVADGKTYAVTFNYKGDAANFGFFTADKEEAGVYGNVGYVDGNKTVLAVNGDGTYTAFVTVDKASEQGAKLYMYAKDVTAAGVVTGETVTDLGNVITNEGASILTGNTSAQAIRYYFGYDTTDGKDIIINGVSYEVKERGFLFANGKDRIDDGAYVGATGFINKAVSGDALANCWQAEDIGGGKSNIWFSTYVDGFAADDDRELFVKGYITFIANGTEFTVYAGASNGSVATIAALQ